MGEIIEMIKAASSMSPLAVIALLGVVIAMLVKNQKANNSLQTGQATITDNHLHGLPEMEATLGRIERALQEQATSNQTNFTAIRETLIKIASQRSSGRT